MENRSKGLFFRSPEEKMVAVLGGQYYQKYVNNKTVNKGFAVMSDKRLYLRGKCYNITEGKSGAGSYQKTHKEKDIDIRDVIGIGFEEGSGNLWIILSLVVLLFAPIACYIAFLTLEDYVIEHASEIGTRYLEEYINVRAQSMLILGAVVFVSLLIYCAYMYAKNARAYITIQYVGGATAFLQRWYAANEVAKFEDLFHKIKDSVTTVNNKVVVSKPETIPTQKASVADEISKLNDLLAQGVISQEEFDKVKKGLLGI